MPLVFVSYSRKDIEFAQKLVNDLIESHIPVWFDQLNISAGDHWDTAIERALEQASHVLIVLSPNAVQSKNVLDEIGYAVDEEKIIVPILLENCKVPLRIRRVQHTDFRTDYVDALKRVLKFLPRPELPRTAPLRNMPSDAEALLNSLTDAEQTLSKIATERLQADDLFVANQLGDPPDSQRDFPILLFSNGIKFRQISLTRTPAIVGRDDDCEIVVVERNVSRHHLRFFSEDHDYFVEDLASKNGTWVNGRKLRGPHPLADGDEINLALQIRIHFTGSGIMPPLRLSGEPVQGLLALFPSERKVTIRGTPIDPPLSLQQYRLLETLVAAGGAVCSHDDILDSIWPDADEEQADRKKLDGLVLRLRDRFAEYDPEWQYVVTVRGHGYRLNNPPLNDEG